MCSEMEKQYEYVSCSLELNPFIYIDRELLGSHFCIKIRDNVYLRVDFLFMLPINLVSGVYLIRFVYKGETSYI